MADDAILNPNDRRTWPSIVGDWTTEWAERLRGSTAYTSDLKVSLDDELQWRQRLAGTKLLAYHCTRLLDHEADDIRADGLKLLSRKLVERKIEDAFAVGVLAAEEREELLRLNTFARGKQENRENRICLVVGRDAFVTPDNVGGCVPLLTIWGGEAINMGVGRELEARLSEIGRPTVVAAVVDLGAPHRAYCLGRVLVGIELGLEDAFGELHYYANVPPADVLDVLQPGSPGYDALPLLPR